MAKLCAGSTLEAIFLGNGWPLKSIPKLSVISYSNKVPVWQTASELDVGAYFLMHHRESV